MNEPIKANVVSAMKEEHKIEEKWVKLPVVDPWKGKHGKHGIEGQTVGYLFVQTEGEYITALHMNVIKI